MEPVQSVRRLSGISGCIDIGKLEHENRKFLVAGFLCAAALLIAISPFVSYRRSQALQETYRRITLIDIVSVPPKDYPLEQGSSLQRDPLERELLRAESHFRFKKPLTVSESAEKQVEHRIMAMIDRELPGEINRQNRMSCSLSTISTGWAHIRAS